jgi:hypothetical protein
MYLRQEHKGITNVALLLRGRSTFHSLLRKDDRNPLNLRQSELKIDVVKCTSIFLSLSAGFPVN